MTLGLLDRLRNTCRSLLIGVGVSIATFQICGLLGLRFNTSPSLPMGLYITTQDQAANLVEFCPVEPFAAFAIVRGYRDPGACPDGAAPLLKPVVARSGDLVELSAAGISVNGAPLRNTAPLSRDAKGRALTSWPFGRYVVMPGMIWVASSYHARSFDSRYFGPIPTVAIRCHLKPLLVI